VISVRPTSARRFVSSSPPRKGRPRLIRQLREAYDSLSTWDSSVRRSVEESRYSATSSEAKALLAILETAKKALVVRLAELGVEELAPASNSPFPIDRGSSKDLADFATSAIYLNACHACGQALGAAFREAQAAADGASARVLYGSLREFEKQIWVLDPCQAN
jgi:hypothetical protein